MSLGGAVLPSGGWTYNLPLNKAIFYSPLRCTFTLCTPGYAYAVCLLVSNLTKNYCSHIGENFPKYVYLAKEVSTKFRKSSAKQTTVANIHVIYSKAYQYKQ